MTTARQIITSTLSLRLNRLSAGESLDDDTAALCLFALNEVVEELNGGQWGLWREILTQSNGGVTGVSGTIGTTWPGLTPCCEILGATRTFNGLEVPLSHLTMQQYHEMIPIKSAAGLTEAFAYDGQATVYLYRAASGQVITLRTKQLASEFADLDTDYTLPNGFQPWLSALVALKVAPPLIGGSNAAIERAAAAAKLAIQAAMSRPAIINGGSPVGRLSSFLNGW